MQCGDGETSKGVLYLTITSSEQPCGIFERFNPEEERSKHSEKCNILRALHSSKTRLGR